MNLKFILLKAIIHCGINNRFSLISSFFKIASKKLLKIYQWMKIKKIIKYSYNNSPFYQHLFTKNNIKPSDIKTIKDLSKIPLTESKHLQQEINNFFTKPKIEFIKVFTTSGSTGDPKQSYFTKRELDSIINTNVIGLQLMTGISSEDVIRMSLSTGYGPEIWGNSYILDHAFYKIGCLSIATERLEINDEIRILEKYNPTIFVDVTSRIQYLTKELEKNVNLPKNKVQKILSGAEPTPNKLRKELEKKWNADIFIGYGISEICPIMASECTEKNGMHLNELSFFVEVIHPKTKKQLPPGEIGELIYTSLNRMGMPIIRYNSHDLGCVYPDMCKCGIPLARIKIMGRTDDLFPIGSGDNIFPSTFDEVILTISEVIEYKIILTRENGKDVMTILAETDINNSKTEMKISNAVKKIPEIRNGIEKSKTIAEPIVKLLERNTFNRKTIKKVRIYDKRNLYN